MINPEKFVEVLNDLSSKDEKSVISFLCHLHPTNNLVLEDYDVKMRGYKYPTIGILSILNKILEGSGKKIKVEYHIETFSGEFKVRKFELEDKQKDI